MMSAREAEIRNERGSKVKTRPTIWTCVLCLTVALPGGSAEIESSPQPEPKQGLERLRQGNEAYRAEKIDLAHAGAARRKEVCLGQHPFATVLTCADSRVPAELIFNQGLGDLFVVRTAGAVPDRAVLGSIEYAAEHLHVPLVVVMGHTSCGAVKAAMETRPPAKPTPATLNLERILSAIRPSLQHTSPHGDPLTDAVYASVEQHLTDSMRLSPVLAELGETGKVMFVGAVYELESGKVIFSEPVVFHHRPTRSKPHQPAVAHGGQHK